MTDMKNWRVKPAEMEYPSSKPLFIMGFSRTGSTLLQQILNKYTEIGIIPEMHLLWPRHLHRDFATMMKRHVGKEINERNIDRLIEMIFSKRLQGVFWKDIDKYKMNQAVLRKKIMSSDGTLKGVFDSLLSMTGEYSGKKIPGAKFPVHYRYVDNLLQWYPECRIVHTVRDPRAVFVSQYYKHLRRSNHLPKSFTGTFQFLHVNLALKGIQRMHEKLKCHKNYHVVKYEELILEPEKTLKDLCRFLNIAFVEDMVNPHVFYNTSLADRRIDAGLHQSSLEAWRTKMPNFINHLMVLSNRRLMMAFGYI